MTQPRCPICRGPMIEELLDYEVETETGATLRLEEVPTWTCERCGETLVEDEVIETIEDMLAHLDEVTEVGEEE